VAVKHGMVKLSCFQHCRRPFYDLKGNPDAVIRYVGNLYHEENRHRIGKDGWTAEDYLRWRSEYAPPIMKNLKKKQEDIASNEEKYPLKSEMHGAAPPGALRSAGAPAPLSAPFASATVATPGGSRPESCQSSEQRCAIQSVEWGFVFTTPLKQDTREHG